MFNLKHLRMRKKTRFCCFTFVSQQIPKHPVQIIQKRAAFLCSRNILNIESVRAHAICAPLPHTDNMLCNYDAYTIEQSGCWSVCPRSHLPALSSDTIMIMLSQQTVSTARLHICEKNPPEEAGDDRH